MTLNDVITLSKAGFTAEQIQKMFTLKEEPKQPAPAAATAQPTGAMAFTEIPNVEPNRKTAIPNFNEFYQGLAKALREDNLIESKQPKPETTEEILAKIINPPEIVGGE